MNIPIIVPDKLYHITNKEAAADILKNGLKPEIGANSAKIGEERPGIYLSNKKSLLYWIILLQGDTVLEIDTTGIKDIFTDNNTYGLNEDYSEFITETEIPADRIKKVRMPVDKDQKIMRRLCFLYLIDVSYFVANSIVRTYAHQEIYPEVENNILDDEDKDYINKTIDILLTYMSHLDYKSLTNDDKKEIRRWLVNEGKSGEYTLCDEYFDTGKRLWQQIVEFEKDETYDNRVRLYKFIKKNFTFCHKTNTGGFTC